MLDDIKIAYLGVTIKVTHFLFKPDKSTPGRTRYTFHLPTGKAVIEERLDENEEFYWSQVPGGRTPLATELGKTLERHYEKEEEESEQDSPSLYGMLEDIEIVYRGSTNKISHSTAKQGKNDSGRLIYTCHFPTHKLTIRQYKENNKYLWKEVPGQWTQLAQDLGELIEKYYNE